MKPRRYHGLKRPKLRQTWNKYNLYNIHKMRDPKLGQNENYTFFQQKWNAKGLLRTYHGEHIVERKWERMFSRRLLSVVDMDTKYMAQNDGSELAAGRGSGKDRKPEWDLERGEKRGPRPIQTPYMQMTFAPMERRLDIAVFRAMFASSARQARQFCVHGAVKVNGKVVPYPAYRLNPGDMFQVDPERVLYATGQPKVLRSDSGRPSRNRTDVEAEEPVQEEPEAAADEESTTQATTAEQDPDTTDAPESIPADMKPTRKQIQDLTMQAKALIQEERMSVGRKKDLRNFLKSIKTLMARAGRATASPAEIAGELSTLLAEVDLGVGDKGNEATENATSDSVEDLSDRDLKRLEQLMEEHMREQKENPYDPSKPYGTPWKPRNYMSAFAFIPQYLEVNHNICSAVYLRHPVARVGSAEVPTPYPIGVNQLGFNWYLRRR